MLLDAIRVNKYWPDKYSFLIDAWETTLSPPLSYTIVGKWQHAHQIRKPVKQQPSRRKVKPLGLRRMHSPFAGNLASHSNFMVAPLRYSPFHFVLLFQIHSHCESKHAVYNTHYTYIHTPNDHERTKTNEDYGVDGHHQLRLANKYERWHPLLYRYIYLIITFGPMALTNGITILNVGLDSMLLLTFFFSSWYIHW